MAFLIEDELWDTLAGFFTDFASFLQALNDSSRRGKVDLGATLSFRGLCLLSDLWLDMQDCVVWTCSATGQPPKTFYPLDLVGDVNVEPLGYIINVPKRDVAFRMLHDDIPMYNALVQNHSGNFDG